MKEYPSKEVIMAAEITGFDNDWVICGEDRYQVGQDWLGVNRPQVGGYLVYRGGRQYDYMTETHFKAIYKVVDKKPSKRGKVKASGSEDPPAG